MQREKSIWFEAFSSYARVCARSIFLQITLISLLFFAPAFATFPVAAPNDFQMIRSTDTGVCLPAIERLGQSRDVSFAPALITALGREKRPVVRRYLVEALGLLRDESATPVLIQALQDSNAQVRQSAVLALQQVGGDDAEAALVAQAGKEHDLGTKVRLVSSLEHSRHPHTDEGLKQLATDSDPVVSAAAAKALSHKKARYGETIDRKI